MDWGSTEVGLRWKRRFLRGARVRVPSEKMSLGMGRSPCSKGSRRGRRRSGGVADDVDEVEGSTLSSSLIADE